VKYCSGSRSRRSGRRRISTQTCHTRATFSLVRCLRGCMQARLGARKAGHGSRRDASDRASSPNLLSV
jgi:hypothetical protein